MAVGKDWMDEAAKQIVRQVVPESDRTDYLKVRRILEELCPFERGVIYVPAKPAIAPSAFDAEKGCETPSQSKEMLAEMEKQNRSYGAL